MRKHWYRLRWRWRVWWQRNGMRVWLHWRWRTLGCSCKLGHLAIYARPREWQLAAARGSYGTRLEAGPVQLWLYSWSGKR